MKRLSMDRYRSECKLIKVSPTRQFNHRSSTLFHGQMTGQVHFSRSNDRSNLPPTSPTARHFSTCAVASRAPARKGESPRARVRLGPAHRRGYNFPPLPPAPYRRVLAASPSTPAGWTVAERAQPRGSRTIRRYTIEESSP